MADAQLRHTASTIQSLDASGEYRISPFVIGTILLRHRVRIVGWILLFGLLATIPILLRPRMYTATATLLPRGGDVQRSSLASLAGQLGVSLPTADQSSSPQLFSELVTTRELLRSIATDTFTVRNAGGGSVSFVELMKISADEPEQTYEKATRLLARRIVRAEATKTGFVKLAVTTQWPDISYHIANRLVGRLNEFNLDIQRSQAAEERRFVGERLALAQDSLRFAEDRLKSFLESNRQPLGLGAPPALAFERDRLQRAVTLRQSVLSALAQSYEEAGMREARDIPVITAIEPARPPAFPNPRHLALRVALGMLLGFAIAFLWALLSEIIAARRSRMTDADEFFARLSEARNVRSWLPGRARALMRF